MTLGTYQNLWPGDGVFSGRGIHFWAENLGGILDLRPKFRGIRKYYSINNFRGLLVFYQSTFLVVNSDWSFCNTDRLVTKLDSRAPLVTPTTVKEDWAEAILDFSSLLFAMLLFSIFYFYILFYFNMFLSCRGTGRMGFSYPCHWMSTTSKTRSVMSPLAILLQGLSMENNMFAIH